MIRRYYWLKLQHDFFNEKRIKKLRKIAGGDTYTIIYLKMQLLSLQNEGKLYFDNIENTFEEEIALQLDEDVEDVKVTIMYLLNCGLLEKVDDEYTLTETQINIGSEGDSAKRVRKYREKQLNLLQCNIDVTKCNRDKIREDKDIEKEKEIEKNKYIVEDNNVFKEIIDYLNLKTNQHYRYSTPKTKTLIKARLKEGFMVGDFKIVIDNMCKEWKNTEMQKYLRPETLFGTKFESYLNRDVNVKKVDEQMAILKGVYDGKIKIN